MPNLAANVTDTRTSASVLPDRGQRCSADSSAAVNTTPQVPIATNAFPSIMISPGGEPPLKTLMSANVSTL